MNTTPKITLKTSNDYFWILLFSLFFMQRCTTGKRSEDKEKSEIKSDKRIHIVTKAMDFQTLDTIQSGWNTFVYDNNSTETHFILFDKYPESKTIENAEIEIGPVFQKGMDLSNEGKAEEGFAVFGKLPEWFSQVVYCGGSGLVSANHSSITTLNLDPGYYVMECYVKNASGVFHNVLGMSKALVVAQGNSGMNPPTATVNITISSADGIIYDKPIKPGEQVISVYFEDQKVHENFVGHDVNLVKLDSNADIGFLEKWMNWADPKGLINPSPEGVTFMGGVNDCPAGKTGYFKVDFKPGQYAFISEVPNSLSKNMFKTFEVSD